MRVRAVLRKGRGRVWAVAYAAALSLWGLLTAGPEAASLDGQEEPRLQFSYGGQAVMEGVMMRGAYSAAIAVRNPKDEIVIHEEPLNAILYRGPISRIPFVRGLTLLWDALGLGTKALLWSADVALGEEEKVSFNGPVGIGTVVVSLALAIGLFFLLPAAASHWIGGALGITDRAAPQTATTGDASSTGGLQVGAESGTDSSAVVTNSVYDFITNLIEGLIRLVLIIAYIWAIGRVPDIRQLFRYHGAEHKTINAYEAGAPLTPESVARFPLEHPRCGTGFILTVVIISVLVFSVLGRPSFVWLLLSRVLLIPVIAGIAYEYLKFTAARLHKPFVRWLIAPNLALQKLTTNEPDSKIIEVGITALQRVLASERAHLAVGAEASESALAVR
jgi:uncharacterized protein YqhQ